MSGNEQELVAHTIQCLKPHFSTLAIFWSDRKLCKDTVFNLHYLSPGIRANARVVAFALLHNSRFNLQCEPTPTQKSTQKWQVQPFRTSAKDYEGHSLACTSFVELPNRAVGTETHPHKHSSLRGLAFVVCMSRNKCTL